MKPRTAPTGFLGKFVAMLLTTVLLVVSFMFSVVFLAVVAVLGLVGLGVFWWKTRAIRRAIREQMASSIHRQNTVIEGEATVVSDIHESGGHPLLSGLKTR